MKNTSLISIDESLEGLAARLSNAADGELISYQLGGVKKQAAFRILHNGIRLVLAAPSKEHRK